MKISKSKTDLHKTVKIRAPKDYPWKVLDSLVQDMQCSLNNEDYSLISSIVRKRDLTAYQELSETWGPQSTIPSGTSAIEFFAKYQASSLLKKFQFPSDAKSRREAALSKFRKAEQDCYIFNFGKSKILANLEEPQDLECFSFAREFLSKLLGESLPENSELTLWSRHGPGANLDTTERATSLYDKYSNWPYSCTGAALRHARLSIQDDERWLGALEDDYRRKKGIDPWQIIDQNTFWADVLKVVPGNRITFVPKSSQIDRSIAIEPCMNLYLQLGVDGFMRRRLKRWGIDLDDQTKNQELARRGSKDWMGINPFVTLDLAAASDSISLEVCRLLLPPQWYNYLLQLRSPYGEYEGEVFCYQKISSMGNGYTFALESAIFAAIVYGVEKSLHGSFCREDVAIYGDDIIVRKHSSQQVIRMLNLCGFTINPEKSFTEGPFRESCGADWFNGTPVRPVFLTVQPSTVMGLWNDVNRLRRILSLRFWGYEFKVCKLIRNWIPPYFSKYTGPYSDEDFDSYMHVPRPTSGYKDRKSVV